MSPAVLLIESMPDLYEQWQEDCRPAPANRPHAYTTTRRNSRRGHYIVQPPCDVCGRLPGEAIHLLTIPGFEQLPGADPVTPTLSGPSSIDSAARQIEQHSPLFSHTDANPQQSLF